MERENSFITRWNDKKDTTVSLTRRTQWVFCLFLSVLIFPHVSGFFKSGMQLNKFPVFLAKMKGLKGVREGAGGEAKGALFLLTFSPGTLCLDASAEKSIQFR